MMRWKELKFLVILFLVMAFVFFYFAAKEQEPYSEAKKHTDSLKSLYVVEDKEEENPEVMSPPRWIDFASLQAINPEIVAWIHIQGTTIDYPVLRSEDSEFYLYHDYQKEVSTIGSIFMDSGNQADFSSRHTILYGHNMTTTQMFSELANYEDEGYLLGRNIIELYLPHYYCKYEIISAYETSTDSEDFQIQFESGEEYIDWIKDRVLSDRAGEKVLTLSTCTNAGGVKERFVVHSRLIEEMGIGNRGF
ncbi:class B sortase [Ohessyouella blattaphilus]|uniref:Class B sortase n=1 Tax=Ohessyouella blattaphilus TaxID=2949333 RepID=A0ABT1ELW5_9FIRM|nr:class B sortase [Ohessyouella blattaphilus]MCP1110267.1 class B sortase [Ohessyouella blattaphilus]MCR8563661.1 class B sortase [Ohessyouella blattaphilus]